MDTSPRRRLFLAWLGTAAATPLAATPVLAHERPPTPRMTEGPFYPRRFPADMDADLTRVAGRASPAMGTLLDVSGRVLDRRGAPVSQASVEVWQCDAMGQYHHVGESPGDEGFQGFGVAKVDAEGRYRFRTIKPVPYSGRTPHIHFLVKVGAQARLVSQMFVEGDPGNSRDGIYRSLGNAERALVTLQLANATGASGAGLAGTLDIVLA